MRGGCFESLSTACLPVRETVRRQPQGYLKFLTKDTSSSSMPPRQHCPGLHLPACSGVFTRAPRRAARGDAVWNWNGTPHDKSTNLGAVIIMTGTRDDAEPLAMCAQ